ncbi:shikimate kinase [Pustulibacterium marinum]|uniref:Shikimate kinase n=1 Tax=Pustulibacterium marinum TaxID=1224947 RepID=A0A1I7FRJ1_9FLAO|nr:shikimate kinase [Pustulibacterium marinum]SFU38761.1 shikimate kinase [Pustulibacterium marinum]
MIFLIGYMGCGKSAVGKVLAKHLNKKFIDFDDYLEAKEGAIIKDIFKNKGEIYFRKAESVHLQSLIEENKDAVIALGGGTPCYGNNMQQINEASSKTFYLNVNVPNLTERLEKEKSHRPVIAHLSKEELMEFIGKHLFERNPFYQQSAFTINANTKTVQEIVLEIEELL